MPDQPTGLFGPGIDILLSPDWENIGLPAAMETVWAVLRAATLANIQAPLTINNPNPDQPAIQVNTPDEDTKDPAPKIKITKITQPDIVIPLTDLGSGGGGTGTSARLVTIKTIKKDSLIVDDPADPDFQGITIAKPPALWATQTAVAPVLSYTLTDTTGGQARTANLADDVTEEQVVVPAYREKDKLVIMQLPVPVVIDGSSELPLSANITWIDMNVDARAWASKVPADDP